jgi:hypothetical protein
MTPKGVSRAKTFRNLQNLQGRWKGGTEMSAARRLTEITIPKTTPGHLLTQGITVKLIQEITRGLERKLTVLIILVQVLGTVLIMTAMTGMPSLADMLLVGRRMKERGAAAVLLMIDLVTDMVVGKGIGMIG